ncbi:MAG: PorP/SprF family type IX secretion system membrane protein [Gemmatimonadaceae bacterium]|nr:PorP/SprF family type IX secretion system membrane protein [Chitinophagaceae bacterium]
MKRIALFFLCFFMWKAEIFAQDPHFSQFFSSPLTLNPALTGKFDGTFRIAGNYRDQWPAISKAFVTSTLSVDAGILPNRINPNDTWGVGVMAMTDRTANGILTSNYISLSTAYHKGLDEDGLHQLGFGFQGTYATKRLDGSQLNFEKELDLNGRWTQPSDEPIDGRNVNVNYVDFNAGVLYNGSTTGYNNFYLGVSMYHINRPKESYMGNGTYTLNPRTTVHAGGYLPVGQTTTLHLSGLYTRQAGANEMVVGGAVAFNLTNEEENPTNFYAGSWIRLNDAIYPYVGFEYRDIRIGASYDVNYSQLKVGSQSRGGIEISLIYVKRPPDGRKGIPCPKF